MTGLLRCSVCGAGPFCLECHEAHEAVCGGPVGAAGPWQRTDVDPPEGRPLLLRAADGDLELGLFEDGEYVGCDGAPVAWSLIRRSL